MSQLTDLDRARLSRLLTALCAIRHAYTFNDIKDAFPSTKESIAEEAWEIAGEVDKIMSNGTL